MKMRVSEETQEKVMYCPICKSEYIAGIKMCSECKVELVESLEGDEETSFSTVIFPVMEDTDEVLEEQPEKVEYTKVYQNYAHRASETRSSAHTLLLVGTIGIIGLILTCMGYTPIHLEGPGKYLSYGVMGSMFAIFVVIGIFSFKSAKKYDELSKIEQEKTAEIREWVKKRFTAESLSLEAYGNSEHIADEMKYFYRFETLKKEVNTNFAGLDASFLEQLLEDLYNELYVEETV